jgi:molecular chaperone DnaK
MAEMNAMWQRASEEMYKNAGAQGGPQGGFDPNMGGGFQGGNPNQGQQNNGGDDTVTDADFEEVK